LRPVSDPVPDVDDGFDPVDGADQRRSDGSALDLSGDGDDARGNGHLERIRIERELPGDDLLRHFVADLPIRPVQTPLTLARMTIRTQPPGLIDHRRPLSPARPTAWPRRPRSHPGLP